MLVDKTSQRTFCSVPLLYEGVLTRKERVQPCETERELVYGKVQSCVSDGLIRRYQSRTERKNWMKAWYRYRDTIGDKQRSRFSRDASGPGLPRGTPSRACSSSYLPSAPCRMSPGGYYVAAGLVLISIGSLLLLGLRWFFYFLFWFLFFCSGLPIINCDSMVSSRLHVSTAWAQSR
jgi:hypothetical protein